MSVLDETKLSQHQMAPLVLAGDIPGIEELARLTFAASIWRWYHEHAHERLKVKLWIFRPSVRVSALRWVIEGIAGPDSTGGPEPDDAVVIGL